MDGYKIALWQIKISDKKFPQNCVFATTNELAAKTRCFSGFTQAPDTLLVAKYTAKFTNPTHILRIPTGTESRHDKTQIVQRHEPGHAMIRYASWHDSAYFPQAWPYFPSTYKIESAFVRTKNVHPTARLQRLAVYDFSENKLQCSRTSRALQDDGLFYSITFQQITNGMTTSHPILSSVKSSHTPAHSQHNSVAETGCRPAYLHCHQWQD